MELWPVQRNTPLPGFASLETTAQERKQIISLLKEELWEQSQASQAAGPQLPLSRAHSELHSEDSLAEVSSDADLHLRSLLLYVSVSVVVSEALCLQASHVFTRQRKKKSNIPRREFGSGQGRGPEPLPAG